MCIFPFHLLLFNHKTVSINSSLGSNVVVLNIPKTVINLFLDEINADKDQE